MTDESGTIASPFELLERKGMGGDVARIYQLVRDNEVGTLVFGLPLNDEGRVPEQACYIIELKDKTARLLKQKNLSHVRIETFDETMTTFDAHEELKSMGVSHAKRKTAIDKMAAVLILKGWLEKR
jgi:putative Holliday junction resolvase